MKPINSISKAMTVLEAERDHGGDFTPEKEEMLAILNLCYDLLARTQTVSSIRVKQPEEMKEPGFEDEYINKYGISGGAFAEFVFALATKSGSVSLRKLLAEQVWGELSLQKIEDETGVYRSNLSRYLNGKSEIQTDTWEKILNAVLKK